MFRRFVACFAVVYLFAAATTVAGTPPAAADKKSAPLIGPNTIASHMWALTSLVLDNHLDPPTRQQMLQDGLRALLRVGKTTAPDHLSRRVSELSGAEPLTALVKECWPQTAANKAGAQLQAAAFQGLLSHVPGHSEVFPEIDQRIAEQLSGNRYVGTGIQISVNNKEHYCQIINPFRGGPARRAGSKPGDLIVQVDDRDARDVPIATIVQWLRGEAGAKVSVVVRQPGSKETRTLNMTRGVVPIDTIYGFHRASEDHWDYRVDPSTAVGYLWVRNINSSTLHELRQAERQLKDEGARALILDLRFSSGDGVMSHAELVADGLLDGGVLWRVRHGKDDVQEFRADRECLFRDWPVVVLINGSLRDNAQQAVIAALKDNNRATLVGEATTGDGYVNSMFHLPDGGGAVAIRTGRLERPVADRGWPVQPDHAVELTKEQQKNVEKWLQEKQLPELPPGRDDRPPQDPQLAKAIELLNAALKTGVGTEKTSRKD